MLILGIREIVISVVGNRSFTPAQGIGAVGPLKSEIEHPPRS